MTLDEIERIRSHYANGVYFGNQDATSLQALEFHDRHVGQQLDLRNVDAVDTTGTTAFAKDDYDRAVVCPAVRSIRPDRAVCARRPGGGGCPPPGAPELSWDALLERAEKRRACAWELQAGFAALTFSPTFITLSRDN